MQTESSPVGPQHGPKKLGSTEGVYNECWIVLRRVFNFVELLLVIFAVVTVADQASNSRQTPMVYIAHRDVLPDVPCHDNRAIRAYLLRNDRVRLKVWLNNEEFNLDEFGSRLDAAFKTRAVWLLFMGADPRVPFGTVTKAIKVAQRHVDYVALITPSVEEATGCLSVSLPFGFKEHGR